MSRVNVSVPSLPIAAHAEEQRVGWGGKPLGILSLGLLPMGHPLGLPRVAEALVHEAAAVVARLRDAGVLYPYPSRGLGRHLCRGFYRGLFRDTCPYPGLYPVPYLCLCLRLGLGLCHPDNPVKTYSDPTDTRLHIFSKTACIYRTCHIPAMTCSSSRRRADMICRSRPAVDPDHAPALDHDLVPGFDHDRAHDLSPDTSPALSPSLVLVLVVSPNLRRNSSRSVKMGLHFHHAQARVARPHARHAVEGRRLRIHLCVHLCPYHLSDCVHSPDLDPCLGLGLDSGHGRGHHTFGNEIGSSLGCSRACLNIVGSVMGGSRHRGLCGGQNGLGSHSDNSLTCSAGSPSAWCRRGICICRHLPGHPSRISSIDPDLEFSAMMND